MDPNFNYGSGMSFDSTLKKVKTGRIALIDADFIKHEIAYIREKEIKNNEFLSETIEASVMRITPDYMNNCFMNKISDPMIFCFSGKHYNTHREFCAIIKKYKGKRVYEESFEGEDNLKFMVMDYVMKTYVSILFEDLEADDIVCALQCSEKTYILSKDKDIKQKPGWHYDFFKNEIYEITNAQAAYSLAYQMICGDTADNIPGLPQWGDVRATAFLKEIKRPTYYMLYILEQYTKLFGVFKGTDMFVEMWNLLKMREDRGEHFKEKYRKMFDTKDFVWATLSSS